MKGFMNQPEQYKLAHFLFVLMKQRQESIEQSHITPVLGDDSDSSFDVSTAHSFDYGAIYNRVLELDSFSSDSDDVPLMDLIS